MTTKLFLFFLCSSFLVSCNYSKDNQKEDVKNNIANYVFIDNEYLKPYSANKGNGWFDDADRLQADSERQLIIVNKTNYTIDEVTCEYTTSEYDVHPNETKQTTIYYIAANSVKGAGIKHVEKARIISIKCKALGIN